MCIEIKIEKANNGDCIWVRYGENSFTNLIIDSGPASFAKGFRELLDHIKNLGEVVDLLVLTHIDDDHIQGFNRYICERDCKEIKLVWFNGHNSNIYTNHQTHSSNNVTSLINDMRSKNLKVITPVSEGYEENINGANLKVITPTEDAILQVAYIIDKSSMHAAQSFNKDLDMVYANDSYTNDPSKTNKASISLIFTYRGKRIAFLGDAHPEDIIKGKNRFFRNQIIDIVKLPHHGSSYNTTCELLECLGAKEFIISTRGPIHKETVARIANCVEGAIIHCNYEWWFSNNFFTENDKKKYIDTRRLVMNALADKQKIINT